jgi:hypothetical protein
VRYLTILLTLLLCSCGENKLVEVRIEAIYTSAEYGKADSISVSIPHTTVTRLDTKARVRVPGEAWGKVGDVFLIHENELTKWQ